MPSLEREAMRLRSLIDDAAAVIVGIGSGMSSAAGFNHYNRAGMMRAGMEDWQQAFGFKSLFDGFYHLYPSLEQQWAYYARYIDFMLREPASQPYLDLRSLIGHKDYFILSTNVDTQVEKTFPAESICNYQGSFAHLQCKQPCCDEIFDASPYVERMLAGMAGFGSRSAARMSPDARTAVGSLCRGCATTRFCRARHGARASNVTRASCASAATASCFSLNSAWAR